MNAEDQDAFANWYEVGAVVGTGLLHFAARAAGVQGVFIVITPILWVLFVVWKVWKDRGVLRRWGFSPANLKRTILVSSIVAVGTVVCMATIAANARRLALPLHSLVLFALYPIWGLIQQFLVQGLLVGNLSETRLGTQPWILVLLGASLFAAVHVPVWPLVAATLGLGLFTVPVFLRYRNLWPLGFHHGWLGTLFYYWILDRDPWTEFYG